MKLVTFFVAAVVGLNAAQRPTAQRFDMAVRSDFFAGFAGDEARLKKGMDACEQALAENPKHAEALVWHGSGLAFQAGSAFQKGDMKTGGELWQRGMEEMNTAVTLAPDNVAVRIPRGAVLLQATMNMPPPMAKPLLESALADYEHVLESSRGISTRWAIIPRVSCCSVWPKGMAAWVNRRRRACTSSVS